MKAVRIVGNCFNLGLKRLRKVLFNNTLNTFYFRLYGIRHMVKNQSDSERGSPLLPHGLLYREALAGTRDSSMSPL